MSTRYLALFGLLALGACTTTPAEPRVITQRVEVQVPSHCAKDVPPAPAGYADDDLAAVTDPVDVIQKVGVANAQRKARLALVEPAITACQGPGLSGPG